MRIPRTARVLLVATLACMLAAAPALAAPDRDRPPAAGPERPSWAQEVRDAVTSIVRQAMDFLRGGKKDKGDQMPGSGLDPDGHKPTTE